MNYLLTIVLILLKVFDKIDWSWIWVFAPIWVVYAIIFLYFIGVFAFAIIASVASFIVGLLMK